jgi:hypothetical protein
MNKVIIEPMTEDDKGSNWIMFIFVCLHVKKKKKKKKKIFLLFLNALRTSASLSKAQWNRIINNWHKSSDARKSL